MDRFAGFACSRVLNRRRDASVCSRFLFRNESAIAILTNKYTDDQIEICILVIYTYIHTYIDTYMHTYIHTHTYTHIHTYTHTILYIYTCIHTYIHTDVLTYIRTYTHNYMHTALSIDVSCTYSKARVYIVEATVTMHRHRLCVKFPSWQASERKLSLSSSVCSQNENLESRTIMLRSAANEGPKAVLPQSTLL